MKQNDLVRAIVYTVTRYFCLQFSCMPFAHVHGTVLECSFKAVLCNLSGMGLGYGRMVVNNNSSIIMHTHNNPCINVY